MSYVNMQWERGFALKKQGVCLHPTHTHTHHTHVRRCEHRFQPPRSDALRNSRSFERSIGHVEQGFSCIETEWRP